MPQHIKIIYDRQQTLIDSINTLLADLKAELADRAAWCERENENLLMEWRAR